MIENIEKFGAKLERQGFGQFCILVTEKSAFQKPGP